MTAPAAVARDVIALDGSREPPWNELQQDRRSGGNDDEERQPGDVRRHFAMNTHTTTRMTAKTVKSEA